MTKILVADPIAEEGLAIFKNADGHFALDVRTRLSLAELKKAIADAEAVIVRSSTQLTADVLQAGKKLKLVGRAGVGVDNIDVPAASRQGVLVVNVPGGNTISAAEHTMALLLALSRNLPTANESLQSGHWNRSQFTGTELQGKTLGLVGMGRIGREVAKRVQAFGMRVIAFDPFASEEFAKAAGVELLEMEPLFRQSDYLSFHVPLNEKTHHLLNAKTLRWLKPEARVINCARGGVIDEEALADALKSRRLKGAALDVFEQEPPPKNHPLFKLPNVVVTPHLGAATEEAQVKVAQELAETIRDFFLFGTVRNAVNLPTLEAETYKELEPYLHLCEKLGRLQAQIVEGGPKEIHINYAGEISQKNSVPLSLSVLQGFLSPVLDLPVNLVNAPLLAKERGLKLTESKTSELQAYASLVTVRVKTPKGDSTVAGTLLYKNSPRVVLIYDLSVDVVPEGPMLIITNKDRPGVIGFLGTVLGKADVNIAGMEVGRKAPGAEAVTVVNVDSKVPAKVMEEIRRFSGITSVKYVEL